MVQCTSTNYDMLRVLASRSSTAVCLPLVPQAIESLQEHCDTPDVTSLCDRLGFYHESAAEIVMLVVA